MEWRVASRSEDETIAIGRAIGVVLAAGDVVLIRGELGAGKTRFVQGIAEGLGTADRPRSPTFVLVNRHRGRLTLHHCDLYRLDTPDEIADLGLLERIEDGDALAVEWPERADGLFPSDSLNVGIDAREGDDERQITIVAGGAKSENVVTEAMAAFAKQVVAD